MLKKNLFLLSGKNTGWAAGILYCLMALVLIIGTGEITAEEKATAVVYAQAKPLAATTLSTEEITNDPQLQIDEKTDKKDKEAGEEVDEKVEIQERVQSEESNQERNQERNQLEESAQAAREEAAAENALVEETLRKKAEKEKANAITLSKDEKEILCRIVEAEATGEDVKGKMLVANVVMNRVKSERFPDSVKKVVFAKRQFSPVSDGRYYRVKVTSETKKAVERVLDGEDYSKGALYFMSRGKASSRNVSWFDRKLTKVLKYGTHEFYK